MLCLRPWSRWCQLLLCAAIGLSLLWLCPPAYGQFGSGMSGPGANMMRTQEEPSFRDRILEEGGPQYGPTQPQPPIVDVQILGRQTVPEQEVWSRLRTRRGRQFDPAVLEADVRRLYESKLFQHVQTKQQLLPEGLLIIFEVVERPTIQYIKYVGNRALTENALTKESGLKVGDALNRYAVEEARRKVEQLYHIRGHSRTVVTILEGDQPQDRGVVLLIDEGQLERFRSVSFVGNTFVESGRLRTVVQSKANAIPLVPLIAGKVDRRKIDEDVERLTAYYRSFGFFLARVGRELQFDETGRWLDLTFVINEGPRYRIRNIAILGNEKFPTVQLMDELNLRPGDYFNLAALNSDRRALVDFYGSRGHVFANVQDEQRLQEEPGELDLVYAIEEGKVFAVGKINVHIAGEHPHTRKNVILNRISQVPGDIIDRREIQASERRLKSSQLFQYDPTRGIEPRIVYDPSNIPQDAEGLAEQPTSTGVYRGQSPHRQDIR